MNPKQDAPQPAADTKNVSAQSSQLVENPKKAVPPDKPLTEAVRHQQDGRPDLAVEDLKRYPAANQECGPWSNLNWGASVATTRVNPAVLSGWGVRNADWQFGVGIQHEILPRVSIDVS